jgi:chorismate dehydratase
MADAAELPRVRIGAVSFLNARPLVQGLERWTHRFSVRYDLPSACADLLHEGGIDLGLVPSIEYLRGDYCAVPDSAVVSEGRVESVAIFTPRPLERLRTLALDTSSRTSVALARVLCARHFGIAPVFVDHRPPLEAMLAAADAALLIGDPALFADWRRLGLEKIDLGEAWQALTGLPFVYAFWAGRPGLLTTADVLVLQHARADGERVLEAVAEAFFPGEPDRAAVGARYLRENIRFRLGAREAAGRERFFALAAEVGAAPGPPRPLCWYGDRHPSTHRVDGS